MGAGSSRGSGTTTCTSPSGRCGRAARRFRREVGGRDRATDRRRDRRGRQPGIPDAVRRHRLPRRTLAGCAEPRRSRSRHPSAPGRCRERRPARGLAEHLRRSNSSVTRQTRPACCVRMTAFRVLDRVDDIDETVLDGWVAAAARAAAARGVVGIVDYEMAWNRDPWERRHAAGIDSLRVEIGVYTEHLERAIAEGLRTGDRLGDTADLGNFKILIDGSLNTRTAYCWDEYAGAPGEFGLLTVSGGSPRRASGARDRARASSHPCTPSATARTPSLSMRSRRSGVAAGSSTRSSWPTPTSRASRSSASPRACSPTTRWTTEMSPNATGPVAPRARSRCARCSMPARTCCSVRMHPSRRSTRGTPSPPRSGGRGMAAIRGIRSRRSRPPKPSPRRRARRSRSDKPADLVVVDRDPYRLVGRRAAGHAGVTRRFSAGRRHRTGSGTLIA